MACFSVNHLVARGEQVHAEPSDFCPDGCEECKSIKATNDAAGQTPPEFEALASLIRQVRSGKQYR